jgi:hypothetical protein
MLGVQCCEPGGPARSTPAAAEESQIVFCQSVMDFPALPFAVGVVSAVLPQLARFACFSQTSN